MYEKPKCDACGKEQNNLRDLTAACSTMTIKKVCDDCGGNANKIYWAKRRNIHEIACKSVKKYLKRIKLEG